MFVSLFKRRDVNRLDVSVDTEELREMTERLEGAFEKLTKAIRKADESLAKLAVANKELDKSVQRALIAKRATETRRR